MKLLTKRGLSDEALADLRHSVGSVDSVDSSTSTKLTSGPSLLERAVAIALAAGLSEEQGASFTGVSVDTFRSISSRTAVADLVNKAQAALALSPEQRIARAIPAVIDKKIRILYTSQDDKLTSQVGTEFLDRHFGKPVQTVNSLSATIQANISVDELDSRMAALTKRLEAIQSQKNRLRDSTLVEALPSS